MKKCYVFIVYILGLITHTSMEIDITYICDATLVLLVDVMLKYFAYIFVVLSGLFS